MMLSDIRAARERRARIAELNAQLRALLQARSDAFGQFNRSAEDALLEASILQIGALDARCGSLLRTLKTMYAQQEGGSSHAASHFDPARRRRRSDRASHQASEKAHQVDL